MLIFDIFYWYLFLSFQHKLKGILYSCLFQCVALCWCCYWCHFIVLFLWCHIFVLLFFFGFVFMRFPTLCLPRNFLILGLCLLRSKSSSSKKGRQYGLFVYRVGGREFSGFLLLFLLCLLREVVDFLCCALFWAGAACDVCSCCCFCCCVWQSLFSLVLMLLIMLIVLLVAIVSCHLV